MMKTFESLRDYKVFIKKSTFGERKKTFESQKDYKVFNEKCFGRKESSGKIFLYKGGKHEFFDFDFITCDYCSVSR